MQISIYRTTDLGTTLVSIFKLDHTSFRINKIVAHPLFVFSKFLRPDSRGIIAVFNVAARGSASFPACSESFHVQHVRWAHTSLCQGKGEGKTILNVAARLTFFPPECFALPIESKSDDANFERRFPLD